MRKWAWVVFWSVAGVGMLVAGFWVNWFTIDYTYFTFNLGWFALIYALLAGLGNVMTVRAMMLTDRELHDWGDKLVEVTPTILAMANEGRRPRDIAAALEMKAGIPEVISLKYMVALSRARKLAK